VKFYTNSSSALWQSLFVGRGRARRREVAFMKEDTRKALKLVGLASTLGLTIVIATFIGLAVGLWLDKVFNTSPWLTVIFLILGIIAGFRNFYRFMSKRAKE
jgi:ATP synthase protein I